MSKYLVKEVKDYFGNEVLVSVLKVLQAVESNYGTIVICKYNYGGAWDVETYFLHKLECSEYIFSNDNRYENWVNE